MKKDTENKVESTNIKIEEKIEIPLTIIKEEAEIMPKFSHEESLK